MHYSTEVGTLQQLFMNSEFSDKCDNIQSQRQMRALFIGPPMMSKLTPCPRSFQRCPRKQEHSGATSAKLRRTDRY